MSAEIQALRDEIRSLRQVEMAKLTDGQNQMMVSLGVLKGLPERVAKLETNQTEMMVAISTQRDHHKTLGRLVERYLPWVVAILLGGKVGADIALQPPAAVLAPETVLVEP